LKNVDYLNLDNNFTQTNDEESDYKEPTFEIEEDFIDWKEDVFH